MNVVCCVLNVERFLFLILPATLGQRNPLAPALRASLYFIVITKTGQPLFGPQAASFNQLLAAGGYPHRAIASAEPHGWVEVRQETPTALEVWAARLLVTGVFDPAGL